MTLRRPGLYHARSGQVKTEGKIGLFASLALEGRRGEESQQNYHIQSFIAKP